MTRSSWAVAALVVLLAGFLDGIAGVIIGLAAVALVRLGATGRELMLASLLTLSVATVVYMVTPIPSPSGISAAFVLDRLLAHHLAFGSMLLLVIGVITDADRNGASHPAGDTEVSG